MPSSKLGPLQICFYFSYRSTLILKQSFLWSLEYDVCWKKLSLSMATRSGEERPHCIQGLEFEMIS